MKSEVTTWRVRLAVRRQLLETADRKLQYWRRERTAAKTDARRKYAGFMVIDREELVRKRRAQVAEAEATIDRLTRLRVRALAEARKLIGVMEQGGNNQGAQVMAIIRANGGTGPEPWCGDFVAHCYRSAGSTLVQRAWASVWWLGALAGLVKVTSPQPGDIVRFSFSHTGLFEKDNGDGTITTIEGNTGPSGAVSDSRTGGDGVYRKVRSKSLVEDYRHVTR